MQATVLRPLTRATRKAKGQTSRMGFPIGMKHIRPGNLTARLSRCRHQDAFMEGFGRPCLLLTVSDCTASLIRLLEGSYYYYCPKL